MANYEKMYSTLFNEVMDIIEKLKDAQKKCEELYVEDEE